MSVSPINNESKNCDGLFTSFHELDKPIDEEEANDRYPKIADDPLTVRDDSCYSNDSMTTKEAARLVFNVGIWYGGDG